MKNDDICGPIKSSYNKIEFHICENVLYKDTLDSDWFAKLPEEYSSDYWLGNYDTIAFHLPNGFQIIEASQSFLIMLSIWAKYEDEVVQYVDFHDLKMHCKNPKDLKINNNMLINGFDIDEKLSTELYFRNKKHINKNELLMSLQKQYDANAREINKMKID